MCLKICGPILGLVLILNLFGLVYSKDDSNDYCNSGNLILKKDQSARRCIDFHNEPCLCELHGKCKYNLEKKQCMEKRDCDRFGNQPVLCRYRHCLFDCGERRCVNDIGGQPTCEVEGKKCGEHCGDICSCKQDECTFTVDGTCKKSPIACAGTNIDDGRCARQGVYYVTKNGICRSDKNAGSCAIEKTVYAVNLGGEGFTDPRGVQYRSGGSGTLIDKHKIKAFYEVETNACTSDDCTMLYKNIVYGEPSKRENGRCISYNISLCEDGQYELIINTIEAFDIFPGEKTFNIKLDGKFIISEIDVMSLTKKRGFPVELVANFAVKDNIIVIEGHEPMIIRNNTISIEFCYGECIFMEGTFEISGFAITKLVDKDYNPSRKVCRLFKGNHWDCINAGCNFELDSNACTEISTNCKPTCGCQLKYKCKCYEQKVQILFLLDNNLENSAMYEFQTKISRLVDDLRRLFPISEFALAYANHYEIHKNNPPNVYDPCYEVLLRMSSDTDLVKSTAMGSLTSRQCDFDKFPALLSLVIAAQDKNVGWEPTNKNCVSKVIILMSKRGLTLNVVNEDVLKGDGSDTCEKGKNHPPSFLFFDDLMQKQNLSLFFVLGRYFDTQPTYAKALSRTQVDRGFAVLEDSSMCISKEIQTFVYKKYNKTNACYWECLPYVK